MCHGNRLKPQSLAVRVKGRSLADYVDLPISEAAQVFDPIVSFTIVTTSFTY